MGALARHRGSARGACRGGLRAGVRRRPRQGASRGDSGCGNGLRPAGGGRCLFELREPRNLRGALQVRLSGSTVQARSQYRSSITRTLRRSADLDDPREAGHLLCRRSRIQGSPSRAHRRRLRLFAQAHARSHDALELVERVRRTLRRCRRGRRQGKTDRQIRLRRADRGAACARPLYVAS